MVLYKVVIGITFNKKNFKLSSVGGLIADDLIEKSKETSLKGGFPYFDQMMSSADFVNPGFTLVSSVGHAALEIQPQHVLFTRSSSDPQSAISIEKTSEELLAFYKIISKALGAPSIRRIGVVGEYFVSLDSTDNSSSFLLSKFSPKLSALGRQTRFHLTFDDVQFDGPVSDFNSQTSDYWNCIYSIYPSELDDYYSEGGFRSSLDVQKYFNPAKNDLAKELRLVVERLKARRKNYKEDLIGLGLLDA
jgi:hypothetical protein